MGQDSTILAKAWCSEKMSDNINFKLHYQIIIIWIFIIKLSSESSPSKVLKIQDNELEKGKDCDWIRLKCNVFSIELEERND